MLFLAAPLSQARAQDAVLSRGDAVVTGFSGVKPSSVPLKPGTNPLDEFFIDPNGPSAQILSLNVPGGAPSGQLISAPAKLQLKASQIGQVFATALDDGQGGKAPNIYLGATSAYGLNIVMPDADGDGWPERVKAGQPRAEWMAGQFAIDLGGGPGSIYKVDGQTGAVSLFATLLDNSGPGVGDIAFDKASRQFFASDLDRGLIYRLGNGGEIIDSFDHGLAGRPAKGLAPVPDDGKHAEIGNAAFNSDNPESWGYTQEERRVHGLAVQDGRLFYAVGGQIWSIGVSAEGFAKDARWELNVEGLPGEGPITDMLFDKQGRLYLAQRGAQRAAYDYSLFAEPEKSAVARYVREEPDNPATDSVWAAEPESYAIGLPPEHTSAEGGIALGYSHDETGALRYGACGEMLWSTGHRLRQSALAQGGEGEGEADVHGLQGNAVSLVRPQNVPPQQSYFGDYDGFFGDAAKAGHMGDVEIWQPCEGAPDFAGVQTFGELPPGIFPPGDVPPDLPPEYPPEYEFETNLKLVKRADPKTCLPWANGWLCRYKVRVTNTGPDNYFGPIVVDDWLPANPPGAVMGFSWAGCGIIGPSSYRCPRFGVFLAPSGSIDLTAYAWVPKINGLCHLRNVAAIKWAPGGSQWNSDPTDDEDDANALIPDPDCKPGEKTDLKIYKRAMLPCFPIAGDKVRCGYRVTVENRGPGSYNGNIEVKDTIPAGTTPIFSGPGWACAVAAPTSTCAYAGASLPNVGDTVSFIVRIDMPRERARQLNCKVPNEVEITEALGGTPQNTDSTNDTATAVADVPDAVCLKPPTTNLRITKKASPTYCSRSGNDWWCSYAIRVWNMGPAKYEGPIEVEEALPGEPADASWNAPWNCAGLGGGGGGAICTHPNAIGLQPFAWRSLYLKVKFSGDLVKEKNCLLPNVAKITKAEPGTDQNTNPGDDIAADTAKVPAWFCKQPPPEPANLELRKHGAQLQCNIENGKWRCPYNVVVKNTGPGTYKGEIVVKDWLPAAAAGATMEVVAPWTCGDNTPPTVTCTHPYVELAPQQQVVMLNFFYISPGNYQSCSLLNTARILKAPGGSVQNTNVGDDQASASLNFPPLLANGKTYCYSPEPSTCPPGFRWGGESCDRIGITTPPPPIRTCPAGSAGKYPNCETDDDPDCPPGTVGEYPNCRTVDPKCPAGTVGTYPKCRDKPDGSTPECTDGRVRRGSVCGCPGSLVWNGDQCVRRKCPEGMRGTFPNCTKVIVDPPKCRKGTIGRWPNCEKIVKICPAGTVGKYPNCRKIPKHCPPGMTGKPPRCHPIVRPCPSGMAGRPPNCERKPLKLQQPQRFQKFQKPSFGQGLRGRPSGLRLR